MGVRETPLYIALVHWPVLGKAGDEVSTSITHFDIHDIARVSKAYGAKKYFIVHKMQEQLMYVSRVLSHWNTGEGAGLNPMRQQALAGIELSESIELAVAKVTAIEGQRPKVVATAARSLNTENLVTFRGLRESLDAQPVLVLFGTGYGLTPEVLKGADALLEPIKGESSQDYRHLSVRSAVSICLDRLFGSW